MTKKEEESKRRQKKENESERKRKREKERERKRRKEKERKSMLYESQTGKVKGLAAEEYEQGKRKASS